MRRASKLGLALAASLLVSAATASGAAAATRYAVDTGGANGGDCSIPALACTLPEAIDNAADGDEIVIEPGTYELGVRPLVVQRALDIHGAAGQPRPLLTLTVPTVEPAVHLEWAGARLSDVDVRATAAAAAVAVEAPDVAVTRVNATGRTGCSLAGDGVTLSDSICVGTDAGGAGVEIDAVQDVVVLRHVTAIGRQDGVRTKDFSGLYPAITHIFDTIAHGGSGYDIHSVAGTALGTDSFTSTSRSNYATTSTDGLADNVVITDDGGHQTAAPVFVDPAGGDYHEAAGSPTIGALLINAGDAGTADVDGDVRGASGPTDIGADDAGPNPPQQKPQPPPPPVPLTRYAATDGDAANAPCTASSHPCDLPTAVASAADGDTVVVAGGSYALAATLTAPANVAMTIEGTDPQHRPVITGPADGDALDVLGGESNVQDLDLRTPAGNTTGAALRFDGWRANRVLASGPGAAGGATCELEGEFSILRNSVCTSTGASSAGIAVSTVSPDPDDFGLFFFEIDNVTALATGAGSDAIRVSAPPMAEVLGDITNTIARGVRSGVSTDPIDPATTEVAFNVKRSNASGVVVGDNTSITLDPSDQTAPPALVNAAGPDFDVHEVAGSPTIGAGAFDGAYLLDLGPFDIDGEDRVTQFPSSKRLDIGADQAPAALEPPPVTTTTTTTSTTPPPTTTTTTSTTPPPTTTTTTSTTPPPTTTVPPPTTTTLPTTTTTTSTTPPPTTTVPPPTTTTLPTTTTPAPTAPAFLKAVLSPVRFAVKTGARRPASRVPRGATVRFTLTHGARVTATVLVRSHGRWKKVGTAFSVAAKAGATTVRFSGLVRKHALKPGSYELRFVATDAAKRVSKPKTLRFRIVNG